MRIIASHDRKALRQFGLGFGLLLALLFWALVPWLWDRPRPAWPLLSGAAIAVAALAWPIAIYPLYRLWLPVARVLGIVNTWLLLGTVFFGILLPLGWILRRTGRLQYDTRFDPQATSYRIDVDPQRVVSLEEPF